MKKSAHLTPGEFELMEILWPLGEASVKDVWEKVNPDRGLAYTTVMTVLEKMHRKGFLSQRKKGKAYLYSAVFSRDQVLAGIVEHVSTVYFAGSYRDMLSFISQHLPGTGAGTNEAPQTAEAVSDPLKSAPD